MAIGGSTRCTQHSGSLLLDGLSVPDASLSPKLVHIGSSKVTSVTSVDPDQEALENALVVLKVGNKQMSAAFAVALNKEGVFSLQDLNNVTDVEAADIMARAGFSKLQQNKVLQSMNKVLQSVPLSAPSTPPPPRGFGAGIVVENYKSSFAVVKTHVLFPLGDDGKFMIPSHISRVWIDIGADWKSFSNHEGVYAHPFEVGGRSISAEWANSNNIFTIAIDANQAYHSVLSQLKNTIAIPCAISSSEGTVEFYHYEGPGCSSVLPPNPTASDKIPSLCQKVKSRERICSVSLETIISFVPESVPIELLKVDAQGIDLSIVKSARSNLQKLHTVVIEAQEAVGDKSNLLSVETELKPDAIEFFQRSGFTYDETLSYEENKEVHEWNLFFHRK